MTARHLSTAAQLWSAQWRSAPTSHEDALNTRVQTTFGVTF